VAEVRTAVLVLGLGLPLVHMVKVPMARLERDLDYRRVAVIELVGNLPPPDATPSGLFSRGAAPVKQGARSGSADIIPVRRP
jgi:hypothetical protein